MGALPVKWCTASTDSTRVLGSDSQRETYDQMQNKKIRCRYALAHVHKFADLFLKRTTPLCTWYMKEDRAIRTWYVRNNGPRGVPVCKE